MNDLNAAIRDLDVLVSAYNLRAFNNGPGHADNEHLHRLGDAFEDAAHALRRAIRIAQG